MIGFMILSMIYFSTSFSTIKSFKLGAKAVKPLRAAVGSRDLDWPNLGFEYRDTNCFVEVEYKDGAWGSVKTHTDPI